MKQIYNSFAVQELRPDHYFNAEQQKRLEDLMTRWRHARDAHSSLPPSEQAELNSLVEAELRASADRAADMARGFAE